MAPSGESHSIFVVQQTFRTVRRGYDPGEREAAAYRERLRDEAEDELEAYAARRRREADRLAEAARRERFG